MIDLANIRSLSDFQRNTKEHLARLKASGKPEVLTVNGHAELVVQSAESYQKMLEEFDYAESVRILKQRLANVKAGALGDIPAEVALARY